VSRTKTPSDKRLRVYRGGSGNSTTATFVRAAIHNVRTPSVRIDLIGFRTAQSGCRQHLDRA
jgi:formylglycine-generating enzyme required for sulfatase activity